MNLEEPQKWPGFDGELMASLGKRHYASPTLGISALLHRTRAPYC
jgi:hypothetical protein